MPKINCAECRELLVDPDNINSSHSGFLQLRNNGGLVVPSEGVTRIINTAERHLRYMIGSKLKPLHAMSRLRKQLEMAVLSNIDCSSVFGNTSHIGDTLVGIESHIFSLVRHIVRFFLDIRIFHIAKAWNIEQKGVVVRQTMTKLVLFKNQ